MNEQDLTAQAAGSGIVDVGAAVAGRKPDLNPAANLPPPVLPEVEEEEQPEQPQAKQAPSHPDFSLPDELPSCLKESFALLNKVDALAEDRPAKARAKAGLLARIRAHCFNLQQGLPLIQVTADDLGASHASREANYAEYQINQLARNYPIVAALRAAHEALVARVNKRPDQKQLADLSAQVKALTKERDLIKAELEAAHSLLAGAKPEQK